MSRSSSPFTRLVSSHRSLLRSGGLASLVVLILASPSIAQERLTLVGPRTEITYRRGTEAPPANWRENTEIAADGWTAATVPLGYGETFITRPAWTILSDMSNSYTTVYLRIPFDIPAGREIQALDLLASFDDGFIASINGVEIGRASMPDGEITHETEALSHEATDGPVFLEASSEILEALVPGRNLLAVEVHNASKGSSDLVFEPTLRITASELFIRGADCDGETPLNLTDVITLLGWSFGSFPAPDCPKACDVDDSGTTDLSDAIRMLEYLFLSGPPPAAPFPAAGKDPTPDDLPCISPVRME